jgi:ABC-type uncharacterized transport system auxiliary subunit
MSETKIYNLYMPQNENTPVKSASKHKLAILIDAPRHLSQPYISSRTSPYQIVISKYSKWDASPSEILKNAVLENMNSLGLFGEIRFPTIAPQGFYALKLTLKSFERNDFTAVPTGEIFFTAFLYAPDGTEVYRNVFAQKLTLENKNFDSLAKGLSAALTDCMKELRNGLINSVTL